MGNSTPQPDAQGLREVLVGLSRSEQHQTAIQWAKENHCVIDMFGTFARDHHLMLFQSGNECENWIDPTTNTVYKMNMLVHVGENILKLLDRIDLYNDLFPELALHLVGFYVMGVSNAYPVFAQPFVDGVRFATNQEISNYMQSRGFISEETDGVFSNGEIRLRDIKSKNVLATEDGQSIFVVDADVERI